MVDFAPGMRTIIRDEEWMIKKIETNSLGNKTLYCVGVSPLVKDREAIFLADLEQIQVVDPAEVKLVADHSPFYKRALLYLESQWRQQIPTDSNLHIGHQAAMDLMPYQLDPAKLSLQRPRQRILIADTVGLGKTLEAGILMSELIARGKGKRILVVTVKSMMTQFQKEMWNRFTIPLVRLDSNRIQKIRANLPSNYNPFFYYDKTIISIDTLKRDVEYRTHLENAYWDIIVIDEAQNVAERGDHQAQRSRLAKLLADRSDTMIMLSATPHDGRAKSFASLMNMLDPTAIADPENYTPEDIKGLCIRRFKKDVKDQVSGSFLERKITLERCHASAQEEYAFDIFAEMQLEMDLGKTKGTGQLFKTSLEKSLFSSPAACIKSIDARLKKLYKKYMADDIKDIRLLEELKTALEAITPAGFTRYQKLLELLRSKEYGWNPADTGDRVVIFTERIETMKYLAERLRQDLGLNANAIQEISGGMSDAEQQRIVEDFGRTESPVRVLVASDVASEGLNLHYLSHRLIHFDIPWSLMVFQQRNGRIDRYGQQKRPDIRYMLIESDNKRIKGDMRIIEILITKEEQALKNIGDPSLLLGKFTIEDEELVVAEAIEDGSNADAFEQALDAGEDDFDPFEALMAAAGEAEAEEEKKSETETIENTKPNVEAMIIDDEQQEDSSSMKKSKKKKPKKSGWKYELFDLARTFIICFIVVMLLSHFVINPVQVDGDSMYPTLSDSEIGVMNIFLAKTQGIKRQDVVVVYNEETDENWVKRVIGMPNDTVYAKDDVVYVNDKPLEEPYLNTEYANHIRSQGKPFTEDFNKITLGKDEYFLMGDNRVVSYDSRAVGPFKKSAIVGKDVYVLFPFTEIKMVRNGAPE